MPGDTSLKGAAEAWIASGSEGASTWSNATIRGRQGVLNLLLADYGSRSVSQVAPADIQRFLSRPGLKPASRESYYRVLNTFFRWCVQQRYAEETPTQSVAKPAGGRKEVTYFTRAELKRFSQAALDYYRTHQKRIDSVGRGNFIWIEPLVRFAASTGLRKGELRHLRWCDVDTQEEKLFVRSYEGVWKGTSVTFRTKCSSDRVVPLYPMALAVLDERAAHHVSENPEEPVFLGPTGRHLGDSQINRAFRQVRRAASLPEQLDVHALRHTFATWLLSEGETLYRVSRWMGHKSVSVTADLYGHVVEGSSQVGVRVFG